VGRGESGRLRKREEDDGMESQPESPREPKKEASCRNDSTGSCVERYAKIAQGLYAGKKLKRCMNSAMPVYWMSFCVSGRPGHDASL